MTDRERVAAALEKIGPRATKLLADLADRLVEGLPYGDFEKPKDWLHEAYQEELDNVIYRAAHLANLGKHGG